MRNEFGESRLSKYISVIYMALNKSNLHWEKHLSNKMADSAKCSQSALEKPSSFN